VEAKPLEEFRRLFMALLSKEEEEERLEEEAAGLELRLQFVMGLVERLDSEDRALAREMSKALPENSLPMGVWDRPLLHMFVWLWEQTNTENVERLGIFTNLC